MVGEYVSLRRAGAGSLKGLCPFHDEKTPSFNVRPTHGTFHCFGCGEGGDVIAFLMKIEDLGFVEAVERLADRAGSSSPTRAAAAGPAGQGHAHPAGRGQQAGGGVLRRAAAHARGVAGVQFLAERGFDAAAAAQFGCGYAPGRLGQADQAPAGRGFALEELIKGGLSKEGRRGPIDRFHRRLLWPIRDLGGDVVGFGARRLFDDDQIQAKYLNTTESPIYKKSQVLFGLDLAKREIAKRHQVVVVEGYTDVMAMHLAGVPTAVASCGTAFGTEHIAVLRRLIGDDAFRGEVIFTFDGDEAGQTAALKAFDDDQKFAAQTFIAVAPDGQDPCELRQAKGDAAVRDLVARRKPLFEFAIRAELPSTTWTRRGPGRGVAPDRADGRADQGRVAARRVRPPARRLGRLGGHRDGRAPGAGDRGRAGRTRPGASAAEQARRGRRRAEDDPRLHLQREALKVALQEPGHRRAGLRRAAGGGVHATPRTRRCTARSLAAGGMCGGLPGAALLDAVRRGVPDRRCGRWSPSWPWSRWMPATGQRRRGPVRGGVLGRRCGAGSLVEGRSPTSSRGCSGCPRSRRRTSSASCGATWWRSSSTARRWGSRPPGACQ